MAKHKPVKKTEDLNRLYTVFREFGGTQAEFGEAVGFTQSYMSKVFNGSHEMPFQMAKAICHKLGYSPAWLLTGSGPKKTDRKEANLATDITQLRTEIAVMAKEFRRMQIRMKAYEQENQELRSLAEELAESRTTTRTKIA